MPKRIFPQSGTKAARPSERARTSQFTPIQVLSRQINTPREAGANGGRPRGPFFLSKSATKTKLYKPKQGLAPPGGWVSIFHSHSFSIQAVSRCFNPFQPFFRKKRLFIFFGGWQSARTSVSSEPLWQTHKNQGNQTDFRPSRTEIFYEDLCPKSRLP